MVNASGIGPAICEPVCTADCRPPVQHAPVAAFWDSAPASSGYSSSTGRPSLEAFAGSLRGDSFPCESTPVDHAGAAAKGVGKPLQLWGLEFRDPDLDPVDLDAPPAPHVARIAPPPIFMCSDLQSFIAITEFQALSELQALDDFVGPWQVANDDCEGRLQFLQSTIDWVYCIQDFDLQEAIGQLWTWEICGLDWQIAHRNRGCCMGSRTCECGVRVYGPALIGAVLRPPVSDARGDDRGASWRLGSRLAVAALPCLALARLLRVLSWIA